MSGECERCGETPFDCWCYKRAPIWISIRHRWPYESGTYAIKDCRHDAHGTAYYNGYEFEEPKLNNSPVGGGSFLTHYLVTHWTPLLDEERDSDRP